jgi:hypothetical protein
VSGLARAAVIWFAVGFVGGVPLLVFYFNAWWGKAGVIAAFLVFTAPLALVLMAWALIAMLAPLVDPWLMRRREKRAN